MAAPRSAFPFLQDTQPACVSQPSLQAGSAVGLTVGSTWRSAPPPHLAHKVHPDVVTGTMHWRWWSLALRLLLRWELIINTSLCSWWKFVWRALMPWYMVLFCFFELYFCPRHSSFQNCSCSHLIHSRDLTKSALIWHIKKKKILHLFRNNFYYDSHVLHLWWNTNNVKIYFKTETHYFRTTNMNLLGHLINDGAVKCLRSVLSDTD